jgi:kynurenine formamidase
MKLTIDFSKPIADLSLAVSDVARAWYIDAPEFSPVVLGEWTGSIAQGGSVNFFNVQFNPHAHGTHTETAGHITEKRHSINTHFRDVMTKSLVLTLLPQEGRVRFEDFHAVWTQAQAKGWTFATKSVVFRTNTGNHPGTKKFSGTDWPFLEAAIGTFLREQGVDHLIIDQPSVDREEDGGALACHHAFWGPQPEKSLHRTITELAHVPMSVADGPYALLLQVAPIENDAAPSRPLLYSLG